MAKITVTYRDSSRPADVVSLGAYSQIAAKRRYGVAACTPGDAYDPEVTYFGAFVELEGPAVAKDEAAFDEWLLGVEQLDVEGADEEDPTTATTETPPSASSPVSPPTSA